MEGRIGTLIFLMILYIFFLTAHPNMDPLSLKKVSFNTLRQFSVNTDLKLICGPILGQLASVLPSKEHTQIKTYRG